MTDTNIAPLADLDAERQLLAAVITDNGLMQRLEIEPEDFADAAHARIWEAARAIIHRGQMASVATLMAAVPEAWSLIGTVPDMVAFPAFAEQYATTVRDFAIRRRALAALTAAAEQIRDTSKSAEEIIGATTTDLSRMGAGRKGRTKRSVAANLANSLRQSVTIYPTGLEPLDEAMGGGLIGGKLYGIAARKKVGKTVILGTISHNLNGSGIRHAFINMEMSPEEVEQRNCAREMGFNSIKFLTRDLPDLARRVGEYATRVADNTIYEHAPGANFGQIRRIIERARLKGAKGVILDYLQLIQGKGAKETEEYHLRQCAQSLADIAQQTGLWFVVAAQLNQTEGTRGGEGLNLACDQYYILHREKDQPGARLEMVETRYTMQQDIGSETCPGIWLRKYGPHFSAEPPRVDEWPHLGRGEAA